MKRKSGSGQKRNKREANNSAKVLREKNSSETKVTETTLLSTVINNN